MKSDLCAHDKQPSTPTPASGIQIVPSKADCCALRQVYRAPERVLGWLSRDLMKEAGAGSVPQTSSNR
jgi:hypothetical protein